MSAFSDFYSYVRAINPYGMESGIVKIIPPAEWVESLPKMTPEKLESIKIRNPIVQSITGSKGLFVSENMERHRTYSLPEWKHLSMMLNHRPPVPRGTARSDPKKLDPKGVSLEDFDYDLDTLEFTPERCEFLERTYWRTLGYAQPMYGADCLGSVFDDLVKVWNVAKLPNLLDYLEHQIPGVNEAYLYAGLWKALFAWHLEDQDLHLINFLHFGAPKQWYAIPQSQHEKFYLIMAEAFPEDSKQCSEFLRHKTFVLSPQYLESKGIKVNKVTHHKNEFIITFPYGYHAGFNYDYNLAESVNFALEDWLPIGLKAKKCECVSDSVGIDMQTMIRNIEEKTGDRFNLSRYLVKTSGNPIASVPSPTSDQSLVPPTLPSRNPSPVEQIPGLPIGVPLGVPVEVLPPMAVPMGIPYNTPPFVHPPMMPMRVVHPPMGHQSPTSQPQLTHPIERVPRTETELSGERSRTESQPRKRAKKNPSQSDAKNLDKLGPKDLVV